jgi:hypothetical protein
VRAAYNSTKPIELAVVKNKPITIEVSLCFSRAGRRDAHNYTGTVVKTIVDELVRCGLVPDDTPEWVTVKDPRILHDKSEEVRIVVSLNNAEEQNSGEVKSKRRPVKEA